MAKLPKRTIKQYLPRPPISVGIFAQAGLSQKDVEFCAFYFFDCLTYKQIGQYYGISKPAVKYRIDKCLRYLRTAGIPFPFQLAEHKPVKSVSFDPQILDKWHKGKLHEEDDVSDSVI